MKFYIFSILLVLTKANIIRSVTKGKNIQNEKYEQEVLRQGVQSPYQLAIDYETDTLFFSYTARTTETFKTAYLGLTTNTYGVVNGINGGFSNAIDGKNHVVYMGGDDGIYTFDYDTKNATKLQTKFNGSIWNMFYKNGLYFTTYPDEKAYLYKDGNVVEVSELASRVVVLGVTKFGNYIYSNSSGLFAYNKITKANVHLGDFIVNGLTADKTGNLYFSTPRALYAINDKQNTINELATFNNIYGIAIEEDGNIIYANESSIIRLKLKK